MVDLKIDLTKILNEDTWLDIVSSSPEIFESNSYLQQTQLKRLNDNNYPIKIDAGSDNGLILTSKGHVYFFGQEHGDSSTGLWSLNKMFVAADTGDQGQTISNLSQDILDQQLSSRSLDKIKKPTKLEYVLKYDDNDNLLLTPIPKILDITTDGFHSLLLDFEGTVYGYGDNDSGQTGTSSKDAVVGLPLEIRFMQTMNEDGEEITVSVPKIKAISTGMSHSILLTENGSILTVGGNRVKQVANIQKVRVKKPIFQLLNLKIKTQKGDRKIKLPLISKIITGEENSFLITEEKQIISFGDNSHEKLGYVKRKPVRHNLGPPEPPDDTPVLVSISNLGNILPSIKDVASGVRMTVLLTTDGEIYTSSPSLGFILMPLRPHKIRKISGKDINFLFLYENGQVMIVVEKDVYPQKLNFDKKVIDISSGPGSNMLLTVDNQVYKFKTVNIGDNLDDIKYKLVNV